MKIVPVHPHRNISTASCLVPQGSGQPGELSSQELLKREEGRLAVYERYLRREDLPVPIHTLAEALGLSERTLRQDRSNFENGRRPGRDSLRKKILMEEQIDRRVVLKKLASFCLTGKGLLVHPLSVVLRAHEFNFLEWWTALIREGRILPALGTVTEADWNDWIADMIDQHGLRSLCYKVLERPELFLTNYYVQRVLASVVGHRQQLQERIPTELYDVSVAFKESGWTGLAGGPLSNLALCTSITDDDPSRPNEYVVKLHSGICQRHEACLRGKFRMLMDYYGFFHLPRGKAALCFVRQVTPQFTNGDYMLIILPTLYKI